MQYEATLVAGRSYTAFGQTFLQGIPGKVLLSESEKSQLDEEAVDVVKTTDGERMNRPKFNFKAVGKKNTAEKSAGGDGGGEGNDGQGGAPTPTPRRRRAS